MEPLGWDEIVSQPGMGGYLSFLNGPVPLPHLQPPISEAVPDPGVDFTPAIESSTIPVVASIPDLVANAGSVTTAALIPDPAVVTTLSSGPTPAIIAAPPTVEPIPAIDRTPVITSTSDSEPTKTADTAPEVASSPVISLSSGVHSIPGGQIRIRKCATAQDGHSLGEEVLYQALWKAAKPESEETRTIVIGWRGMSQLCRMTPKNCKINTQRLIRKLALEVLSPYNTPESIGTTYRVYSTDAIVRRRRAARLEWVVRSRGVEFVDPATGSPVSAHLCSYVSD
jgi:hypothetical protein